MTEMLISEGGRNRIILLEASGFLFTHLWNLKTRTIIRSLRKNAICIALNEEFLSLSRGKLVNAV
jgi:hypothetical protein